MAVLIMAHNNTTNDGKNNANSITDDLKPTIFHDFLGRGSAPESLTPVGKSSAGNSAGDRRPQAEGGSPAASASIGASSGGGRGPISSTSDLGSERQVVNHFEGVPFYGPRSDFSGSDIGNRYTGSKRSNSDSVFIGSSRDGFPRIRPDIPESSHLMKMFRDAGGERPRRPHEDERFVGIHPMRPASNSLAGQPATSGKNDTIVSKWERAIPVNVGPVVQYPPRATQVVPYGYQAINRFRDGNAGPSFISQSAADEGSRTGIKGSRILSSVNVGGVSDRNPSSGGKQKADPSSLEPGSSAPLGRQGSTSSGRQMTIFYGGQAHVFDDVHPNKADVIMALAGSNGGSWSTSFLPNSAVKQSGTENHPPSGENETGMVGSSGLPRDARGRPYVSANPGHGFGSSDRFSMLPGGQGGIVLKDARASIQAAEPSAEEKHEV